MAETRQKHIPVMLDEVLENLKPAAGKVYVDATFGNGGYTKAILEKASCKVIALDRDPNVKSRAEELKKEFGDRFEFRAGQFGNFAELVSEEIDGAVFDIGVSSMQLDQAERGFSFSKEAPLDMRMSCTGTSAADLVNNLPEKELADLIYKYGEEKKSRQIASRIAERRKTKKITTTTELAEIIYSVIHKSPNSIDPATRTFQALRIAVNNELQELENGLKGALLRLVPGGRLVVVSFHSLEDRIVKTFFNENSGKNAGVSRYMPVAPVHIVPLIEKCSKAITPTEKEISANPRARSAKLRFAVKKRLERNPGDE